MRCYRRNIPLASRWLLIRGSSVVIAVCFFCFFLLWIPLRRPFIRTTAWRNCAWRHSPLLLWLLYDDATFSFFVFHAWQTAWLFSSSSFCVFVDGKRHTSMMSFSQEQQQQQPPLGIVNNINNAHASPSSVSQYAYTRLSQPVKRPSSLKVFKKRTLKEIYSIALITARQRKRNKFRRRFSHLSSRDVIRMAILHHHHHEKESSFEVREHNQSCRSWWRRRVPCRHCGRVMMDLQGWLDYCYSSLHRCCSIIFYCPMQRQGVIGSLLICIAIETLVMALQRARARARALFFKIPNGASSSSSSLGAMPISLFLCISLCILWLLKAAIDPSFGSSTCFSFSKFLLGHWFRDSFFSFIASFSESENFYILSLNRAWKRFSLSCGFAVQLNGLIVLPHKPQQQEQTGKAN